MSRSSEQSTRVTDFKKVLRGNLIAQLALCLLCGALQPACPDLPSNAGHVRPPSSNAPPSRLRQTVYEDQLGRPHRRSNLRTSSNNRRSNSNSRTASAPKRYTFETMVGGVAVFDYNNDGLLDIFFTNGAAIPSLEKTDPSYWNRLFRNNGDGTFTDVTEKAGLQGDRLFDGSGRRRLRQ